MSYTPDGGCASPRSVKRSLVFALLPACLLFPAPLLQRKPAYLSARLSVGAAAHSLAYLSAIRLRACTFACALLLQVRTIASPVEAAYLRQCRLAGDLLPSSPLLAPLSLASFTFARAPTTTKSRRASIVSARTPLTAGRPLQTTRAKRSTRQTYNYTARASTSSSKIS